jgi:radical SAM/Cys-rich protein
MQHGDPMNAVSFGDTLSRLAGAPLRRASVKTLQVNLGRRCDLACHHCHVEAGPKRTETMDRRTADRVLALLEGNPGVVTLDLTGGAPELNARFRHLVRGARDLGRGVIDRCNLTVFDEPGQEDTPEFLAQNGVKVVASLPCYSKENVEKQRGRGVFGRSIESLRRLNRLGYGGPGSPLGLDLVYNPQGPSLPPSQPDLEARYRAELSRHFGIEFHRLITITNMPIKRFAHALEREGKTQAYLSLLVNHFNPETIPELMCRHLVSVGYDGEIFDCDFNQMLQIPIGERRATVWSVSDFGDLVGAPIATGSHCYGCTAGFGSSCGGALTEDAPADIVT